jgi:hypothetical protein
MKLYNNNTFKALLLLQSQHIFSKIISEVTEHGITLLKGTSEELDEVKNSIASLYSDIEKNELEKADSNISSKKKRSVNVTLKELIMQQIAMKLDREFAVDFDDSLGPERGDYKFAELEHQLLATGLKKDADEYGLLPLPKSHYCRYRIPTEINGDNDNCCQGENKQCYTEAGCFCDESCYTKYGDCCTDHFVKCYQKLKLCLISIDDEAAEKESNESETQYKQHPQHISAKRFEEYASANDFSQVIGARAFGLSGFTQKHPEHITPNACCAQKPYNSEHEKTLPDGRSTYPLCCSGDLSWELPGQQCGGKF